jgi:hypothetical protein
MAEITSELGKPKMVVIGLTETKRKGTGAEVVGGCVHLYNFIFIPVKYNSWLCYWPTKMVGHWYYYFMDSLRNMLTYSL